MFFKLLQHSQELFVFLSPTLLLFQVLPNNFTFFFLQIIYLVSQTFRELQQLITIRLIIFLIGQLHLVDLHHHPIPFKLTFLQQFFKFNTIPPLSLELNLKFSQLFNVQ